MKRSVIRSVYGVQVLEPRRLLALVGPYFVDTSLEIPGFADRTISADLNGDSTPDIVATQSSVNGIYALLGYGNGTFQPATKISDDRTNRLIAADLNEDGCDDLIVSASTPGGTRLLLSTPAGTFTASDIDIGQSLVNIAVADFNEDGHLDLASVSTSLIAPTYTRLAFGNGDGTFSPALSFSTEFQYPVSVTAADLDEDGHVDLVVGDRGLSRPPSLAVLRGLGDGTFAPAQWTANIDVESIYVIEATGDGHLDLVRSSFSSGFGVYPGNGDGTFGPLVTSPTQSGTRTIADFDNDSIPDVLINDTGRVLFSRGRGDATFEPPSVLLNESSSGPLLATDLTGDGAADLVRPRFGGGALLFYPNTGSGALATRPTGTLSSSPKVMISADFNRDGRDDLASATQNFPYDIEVALQGAGGVFQSPTGYSTVGGTTLITTLIAGDFNGDHYSDLLRPSPFFSSTLLMNRGDGTFRSSTLMGLPTSYWSVLTADFNGDGRDDLLYSTTGGGKVFLSNGDGTFAQGADLAAINARESAVADFDADGALDAATATTDNTIQVFLGKGDGLFAAPLVLNTSVTYSSFKLFAGEFDTAGNADLVLAGSTGAVLFRGNGDRTFQPPVVTTTPSLALAIATDIDDDGLLELVIGADVPVVFNLDSTGVFVPSTPYTATSSPMSTTVALDANDDGKQDVGVGVNGPGGMPTFYLNVGRPQAPAILNSRFDVDANSILFRFDSTIDPESVQLSDLVIASVGGTGQVINAESVELLAGGRTLRFTLPDSMPDGAYRISINAGVLASTDGFALAAEAILPAAESFMLAGDINRDRRVDFSDLNILAQHYGQSGRTFSQGNINYSADGTVDFDDLLLLAQRYGTSLAVADRPANSRTATKRRRDFTA